MKKKAGMMAFVAAVVLLAQSAIAQLWYDDFSTQYDIGGGLKYSPPASPGLEALATNPSDTLIWYRRAAGDGSQVWSSMFSAYGAVSGSGASLAPPAGSTGGAAMRAGYHSHTDEWQQYVEINSGVILDENINYTISLRSKVQHRTDAATNLVGTGSVSVSIGFWDATEPSSNFVWFNAGDTFSNLTSTAWVTNSVEFYGGRMNPKAAGQPLIVRVTKKSPINTTDFESWIDWIQLEGANPYAEWANDEGVDPVDRTADADLDGVDNFTEWATGGDPNNPSDTGLVGSSFFMEVNGTNHFAYITPQQAEYYANGVSYWTEGCDDLADGNWTNTGWSIGGEDGGFNANFNALTNLVGGVESNGTQFIRLRVGHSDYNP